MQLCLPRIVSGIAAALISSRCWQNCFPSRPVIDGLRPHVVGRILLLYRPKTVAQERVAPSEVCLGGPTGGFATGIPPCLVLQCPLGQRSWDALSSKAAVVINQRTRSKTREKDGLLVSWPSLLNGREYAMSASVRRGSSVPQQECRNAHSVCGLCSSNSLWKLFGIEQSATFFR